MNRVGVALFITLSVSPFAWGLTLNSRAQRYLKAMTRTEKVQLLSGQGWWQTAGVERLGLKSIRISDGPHGLRKALAGDPRDGELATCFPTLSALGSSWDPALVKDVAQELARQSQAADVQVLLGPGVNMKRSPLGGRNFEYFSEDPWLTGQLAAAYIEGLQSEGVGASLKHLAGNNQESQRMSMNSKIDLRTLNEIYLQAFEIAVKQAKPWTIMTSYNRLNGLPTAENKWLLDEMLRHRWKFNGLALSDWGAVDNRLSALYAGLNLDMPGLSSAPREQILQALANGTLLESELDHAVLPVIELLLKAQNNRHEGQLVDFARAHQLARRAAAGSIVLLKNEKQFLPISLASAPRLLVIGQLAVTPSIEGGGSSHVNSSRVSRPIDRIQTLRQRSGEAPAQFAPAYDSSGEVSDQQISEAKLLAKQADTVLLFVGLPDGFETEGEDRTSLDLPRGQDQLVQAVLSVQPRTVVILQNGSPLAMPWIEQAPAVVEAGLSGEAMAEALVDVLTGAVNPSGKLAETFPKSLEDTPTFGNFPSLTGEADYREGLFVGYRHYDTKHVLPLFPFGYGLSYTSFKYSRLRKGTAYLLRKGKPYLFYLHALVSNQGARSGHEVVQVYVHDAGGDKRTPFKELKAFKKIWLGRGQSQRVSFKLGRRAFSHYNAERRRWELGKGPFEILVGGSSMGPFVTNSFTRSELDALAF